MDKVSQIITDTLKASEGDLQDAINALCDGQYLTSNGYTDSDQTDIECAVAELKSWRYFCNEHPTESSTIDCIDISGRTNKGIKFQQKYLYKNGSCIGTCAMYPFWKYNN